MNQSELFDWSAVTDRGRVRSKNEDHVSTDADIGAFVLADGMGGHRGGEVASAIAVNTVLEHLKLQLPQLVPGEIDESLGYTGESLVAREAVIQANHKIYDAARQQPQYEGMGTTLVVAVFYLDRLSIAHVGDSRLYRFRQGQLEQLTSDHTMRQELVDRGFYTEQEARSMVQRNLVTRALGVDESVAVDIQEELVLPGDLYALCSDGLYDMLDEKIIARSLGACNDLQRCAQELIDLANSNGGKDNISLILVRPSTDSAPQRRPWYRRIGEWLR
ncbi:Stp1/IreP family PP2C-type Ser/Thr phosphatase [Acidihalobacter prosperus]